MIVNASGRRLSLSALTAAFLIGAAPVAYAQCAAGGSTAAGQTSGAQQAEAATGESGMTVGQSLTTKAPQPDSEIATDQGGMTMDQSGKATAQTGTTDQGSGTTTETSEQTAATDSPAISGADEERIKSMLEQEGYTEVSSIFSCGSYYEAKAMQGGKQVTLQVDLESGRISPSQ